MARRAPFSGWVVFIDGWGERFCINFRNLILHHFDVLCFCEVDVLVLLKVCECAFGGVEAIH